MKKYFLLSFCFFYVTIGFSQGIQFHSQDWKSILAQAKEQNKFIYLDAYTSWCGPCKLMKKKVFTTAKVGQFFNDSFINAAIDMELGDGPELAKTFNVTVYPTHIILNSEGSVVHRSLGYMDEEDFIQFGKDGLDPNKQSISLPKRYNENKKSVELTKQYLSLLMEQNDPLGEEVAMNYVKNQKTLEDAFSQNVLMSYGLNPSSPLFKYVKKEKDNLYKSIGNSFLSSISYQVLDANFKKKKSLEEGKEFLVKFMPEQHELISFYAELNSAILEQNVSKYKEVLCSSIIFEKISSFSSNDLNSFAWFLFEKSESHDQLKSALKLAKESVMKKENYYNLDTLANLYLKTGDIENANINALKAIETGQKNGNDVTSTQQLLNELQN